MFQSWQDVKKPEVERVGSRLGSLPSVPAIDYSA